VLLLSQYFSATKGGGEYVFKIIADSLEHNNHKVWVITNNVSGEEYQESDNLKILRVEPTLQYKGGLPPKFLDNIRYVINTYRKAREIIKNEKIDLIHSNNFSPALAGSLISYFTKIPHITTIHDIFSIYDKEFWKKWANQSNVSYINARLVPFFEKMMMKLRIDAIHTVSDATKKDIDVLGTDKPVYIIPNCLQEAEPLKTKVKPRQFVYLGRLIFYKNLEIILKAFKIVTEEFPDATLVIAGSGPHIESLQKMSKDLRIDNIIFKGHVDDDEKKSVLAESNALLFPSIMEGFGLVMLEAWQQKRPVIVSNISPMSDIVQDKETGFVVDPHDEQKWAEKIIQLIKEPHLSDIMGENGNHELKEKYNQQKFYENILGMYKNVLKI